MPLIGDLHAENFGTWRDHHGVARWGVNDLDELGRGPYSVDLVRLATSCVLSPHVTLDTAAVCGLLLDTWQSATPGHAVQLADAPHLSHLLPAADANAKYYKTLAEGEEVDASTIPSGATSYVPLTRERRRALAPELAPAGRRNRIARAPALRRRRRLDCTRGEAARPAQCRVGAAAGHASDDPLYDALRHALHGPSPAAQCRRIGSCAASRPTCSASRSARCMRTTPNACCGRWHSPWWTSTGWTRPH